MTEAKYPIGTRFLARATVETVVDIHTTTNRAGEVVKVRYVTEHEFLGQTVTRRDIVETTITMATMAGIL